MTSPKKRFGQSLISASSGPTGPGLTPAASNPHLSPTTPRFGLRDHYGRKSKPAQHPTQKNSLRRISVNSAATTGQLLAPGAARHRTKTKRTAPPHAFLPETNHVANYRRAFYRPRCSERQCLLSWRAPSVRRRRRLRRRICRLILGKESRRAGRPEAGGRSIRSSPRGSSPHRPLRR